MNLKVRVLSDWEHLQLGVLLFPVIPLLGVINVIIAAVSIWRSRYREIMANPINKIWGVFSTCLIINVVFAHNLANAIGGLFNFLPFLGLFAATNIFITTPAQLYQIAKVAFLGSLPVHLIGLGQFLFGWQFKIDLWVTTITLTKYDGERITSLFDNSNIFAFYAVFTLVMTLVVWDAAFRSVETTGISFSDRSNSLIKKKAYPKLALVTAALMLISMNIVIAQSRVVLILSCGVFIAYFIHRNWRSASGLMTTFTIGILTAGYTDSMPGQIAQNLIPSIFWKRLQVPYPKEFPADAGRPKIWQTAADLTQERPWTGWGLRSFPELFHERIHLWIGHQHNLLLMLSSEVGIPLALFFVGIVLLLLEQQVSVIRENRFYPDSPSPLARHNSTTTYYLYLVFGGAWIVLNIVDITLFNLTLNTFSWLILGATSGVAGSFEATRYPSLIQRIQTRILFF